MLCWHARMIVVMPTCVARIVVHAENHCASTVGTMRSMLATIMLAAHGVSMPARRGRARDGGSMTTLYGGAAVAPSGSPGVPTGAPAYGFYVHARL